MESKNLAIPILVFVIFAVGLAFALRPAHKNEEESASHPTTVSSPATAPATTHHATTRHL